MPSPHLPHGLRVPFFLLSLHTCSSHCLNQSSIGLTQPWWQLMSWLVAKDKIRTLDKPWSSAKPHVVPFGVQRQKQNSILSFVAHFGATSVGIFRWDHRGRHLGINGKRICIVLTTTIYFIWEARNTILFNVKATRWEKLSGKTIFYIMRAFHLVKLYI